MEPEPHAVEVSVEDLVGVLAYLVSASRTQLDEAAEYAPMRMITAAQRLADALPEDVPEPVRDLVAAIEGVPPTATPSVDPEAYTAIVDGLCGQVAACLLALEPPAASSSSAGAVPDPPSGR